MNVLGIETSCDETAAAIVRNGSELLSGVVYSQVALHRPFGGVVPEIASRSHVEQIPSVLESAIHKSGISWHDLGLIAVTNGPGLAGSLLVGVSAAKALAMRLKVPIVGINHLHAHIYSPFVCEGPESFRNFCPFISLVVSGGHTSLVLVNGIGDYKLLGQTLDDAAGEAFDKAANMLGLGYPGGPVIEKTAENGDVHFVDFPRARIDYCPANLNPDYCFSFSGVKTSLSYYLKNKITPELAETKKSDIAASFQYAVISALIAKVRLAMKETGTCNLSVAGGVAANSSLRDELVEMARSESYQLKLPDRSLCGDNAAMVAGLAGAMSFVEQDMLFSLAIDPSARLCAN
ncbi:MAG: tRNA (adenosine(37)-N6)-threonylcarbamoyltransferase complex transferase subunit TsaD [Lentisphaerae bacterium]|nr:tRNA (adenosine(37)-N6)-threonylcarbamoyltransferase complex transferase subunit TsaD [Lentisphaerota bacterium]